MDKSIEFRMGRYCVFKLHVHLVFVTKYRKAIFTRQEIDALKNIFANWNGVFGRQVILRHRVVALLLRL